MIKTLSKLTQNPNKQELQLFMGGAEFDLLNLTILGNVFILTFNAIFGYFDRKKLFVLYIGQNS